MGSHINLCESQYKPVIYTDTVSTDGYSVQNLLHQDKKQHHYPFAHSIKRGFLAERFIKAPVQVVLAWPFLVRLSNIDIDPVVGSHRSVNIQLLVSNNKALQSWISHEDDDKRPISYDAVMKDALFIPIGRLSSKGASILRFYNCDYPWPPGLAPGEQPNKVVCPVKSTVCQAINCILIRINYSYEIPALGSLHIIGMASHMNKSGTLAIIRSITEEATSVVIDRANAVKDKQRDTIDKPDNVDSNSNQDVSIPHTTPSEFLDALTYELMLVPILLPSGHCISQSSLDRYTNHEASEGRPANDPFTAVPFDRTPGNSPIIHVALKSRIDNFLLKNPGIESNTRTLGRASSNTQLSFLASVRQRHGTSTKQHMKYSLPIPRTLKQDPTAPTCSTSTSQHQHAQVDDKDIGVTATADSQHQHAQVDDKDLGVIATADSGRKRTLDSVLSAILGGSPSNAASVSVNKQARKSCQARCSSCSSSEANICYMVDTCEHTLCGPCLELSTSTWPHTCPTCKSNFTRRDVNRKYI